MRAAFVALVSSRRGGLPDGLADPLTGPRPPAELVFPVAHHRRWSSRDASVIVGAWCDDDRGRPWAWQADDAGLCVLTSPLRRRGEPWATPQDWPGLLAAAARSRGSDLDQLSGEFSGLVVDPTGVGATVTDPFAHRGLYLAEGPSYSVVASTPALAANAASPEGPVARDPWGVCGLAYTKHRIGERTGYAAVRSLPIDATAEIRPGRPTKVRSRQPPWVPGSDLVGRNQDELADVARAALVEELTAAAGHPAALRLMDLTGGKDSRLLLGAAMTAGVQDRFVFFTNGSPEILDVQIARELAGIAGVTWAGSREVAALRREHGIVATEASPAPASWADRMREYVATTGGFCNLSDSEGFRREPSQPTDGPQVLRVNGLAGELLRSTLRFELPDERALVRRFDRHFGHLDLLRPEALRRYRTEWIDEVLDGTSFPGAGPNDRHDAFLLRTQVRSNFGPRLDLTGLRKLMPLSSVLAVRAAYAMGAAARVAERVHRGIVTRASPDLAEHRFAKDDGWHSPQRPPRWAQPASRRVRRRGPDVRAERLDRPPARPAVDLSPGLTAANYKRVKAGFDEPVELLRDLVADRSNPAWDLIDPAAVAMAADRYDQLPRAAHVELLGAATAAMWLAST